jgi:hypothetical protein
MRYVRVWVSIVIAVVGIGAVTWLHAHGDSAAHDLRTSFRREAAAMQSSIYTAEAREDFAKRLQRTETMCASDTWLTWVQASYRQSVTECQAGRMKLLDQKASITNVHDAWLYAREIVTLRDGIVSLGDKGPADSVTATDAVMARLKSMSAPSLLQRQHELLVGDVGKVQAAYGELKKATDGYDQSVVDAAHTKTIDAIARMAADIKQIQSVVATAESACTVCRSSVY